MNSKVCDLKKLVLYVTLAIGIVYLVRIIIIGPLSNRFYQLTKKSSLSSPMFFIMFFSSLFVIGYFLLSLFSGNRRKSFLFFIVILPIIARIHVSVPVYTDDYGIKVFFSLTTFLLLSLFIVNLKGIKGWFKRLMKIRWFPFLILLCASIFYVQCIHLGIKNAIMVVYIKMVQPLLFVVVVSYFTQNKRDRENFIKAMIYSILIAIIVRYISVIVPQTSGELQRLWSSLGPPTIYGFILASIMPFIVYFIIVARNKIAIFLVGIIVISELLQTLTRGAIFSISLLLLFFAHNKGRKYLFTMMLIIVLFLFFFPNFIFDFSKKRSIPISIEEVFADRNFSRRMIINANAFTFFLDNLFRGAGLGSSKLGSSYSKVYIYNVNLSYGVFGGILGFFSFVIIMLGAIYSIMSVYFKTRSNSDKLLYLSVLITILIWFIDQNTTANQLIYLLPQEGVLYFFAILGIILGIQVEENASNFRMVN